ncbi:tyrosine-type recombinase/integrase [Spirosoma arcticum]
MTYNIELTDKPDKRGLHHVMIRLHAKGHKPARIQTSIELEHKHWNTRRVWSKWVRSSHSHSDSINAKIVDAYNKTKEIVQSYLDTNADLTPAQCKIRYEAGAVTLLRPHLTPAGVNPELARVTLNARQYEWNAFLRWAGEDLAIEHITPKLIDDYKRKLLDEGKQPSTINTYISWLRILYETAQKKRGLSKREILSASPFLEWENLTTKPKAKGRLSSAGVKDLAGEEFSFYRRGRKMGNPGRTFFNFRDWGRWCWLACHYQAGMRIGDLIRSRYEWYETDAEGYPVRLRYQMQKNGRFISIPLASPIRAHLRLIWLAGSPPENYVLPFLDSKAKYARYRSYEQIRAMPMAEAGALATRLGSITLQLNRGLSEAVKAMGITVQGGKRLTNHTARHSFADKLRQAIKDGKTDAKGRAVTTFDAKDLLGHGRLQTTELYFGEIDQEWLDSAMDALSGE